MPDVTIASFLGSKTTESIKAMCINYDVVFDDKFMVEQNLSKEQFLTHIMGNSSTFNKVFQLRTPSQGSIMDQAQISAMNRETNARHMKINSLIRAVMIRDLTEEALQKFLRREEMKERMRALHDLIRKLSAAEDARQLAIYEAERMQLEEQARFMMAMAEYDRAHHDTMKQIESCFKLHDELTAKHAQLKEEKQQILMEHAELVVDDLSDVDNVGETFAEIYAKQNKENPQEMKNYRAEMFDINYKVDRRMDALHKAHSDRKQALKGESPVGRQMLTSFNISNDPALKEIEYQMKMLESYRINQNKKLFEKYKLGTANDIPESEWKKVIKFASEQDKSSNGMVKLKENKEKRMKSKDNINDNLKVVEAKLEKAGNINEQRKQDHRDYISHPSHKDQKSGNFTEIELDKYSLDISNMRDRMDALLSKTTQKKSNAM
ncbi:MAG: hypothetical protein BGO43_13965 [Gammaproteobacteria bacterium 39-13]|nr:hypothetical protein [Gammaproteobacteria bacterium]OJV85790.1 MAG: hypothetical protein BGO43_13965 [Gammaproteobacteria bacterium 39-13]